MDPVPGGEPDRPEPSPPERQSSHSLVPPAIQHAFERRALFVVVYVQLLVAIGIATLPLTLGAAGTRFATPAAVLFVVLCVAVDWFVGIQIGEDDGIRPGTFLYIVMSLGVICMMAVPGFVAWAIFIRSEKPRLLTLGIVAGTLLLGLLLYRTARGMVRARRAPWVAFGTAITLLPAMLAWAFGSVVWVMSVGAGQTPAARLTGEALARMKAAPDRPRPAHCQPGNPWLRRNGEPIRVALALSGGGYRAAITHAGLLASLEEQCVDLEYLTTVSGGSIVGAHYGLGLPPQEFASDLMKAQPGLSTELLLMWNLLADWFVQSTNSADTYAAHFKRFFFSDATLSHVKEKPVLLLNATDIRGDGTSVREVFARPRVPLWDKRAPSLADVVAASGAFPGAFQPKVIRWLPPGAATGFQVDTAERIFIDGGVVENLGLDGLLRYLALPSVSGPPPRPHILVVADASRYAGAANVGPKANVVSLMVRAANLSWDALHRHIYAQYTRDPYYLARIATLPPDGFVVRVRYADLMGVEAGTTPPRDLLVIVIPTTAPATKNMLAQRHPGCAFDPTSVGNGGDGAEVQEQVAAYGTLEELDASRVLKAYWLGYVLGKVYRSTIECARRIVDNPKYRCSSMAASDVAVTCPTGQDVRAMLQARMTEPAGSR